MSNIKLIASDLDGTLLNDKHYMSDYTVQVWKKVREKGIHIMPVTGRPLIGVLDQTIPRDMCEYTINANGVHVFKIHDNREEIIWDKSIEWSVTNKVIKFLQDKYPQAFFHMYVGQDIYALELNERTDEYSHRIGLGYNIIDSWDEIENSSIVKMMVLDEYESLQPIQEDLSAWSEVNAVFSSPSYLEIFHAEASKGNALLFLANKLGIDRSEILGMGDAGNDVSMLEVCGHAYMMKNADDSVAPQIPRTDFTNDEDGVARHIEKLLSL